MRKLLFFTCLLTGISIQFVSAQSYEVTEADINQGYIYKKIWLQEYSIPQVTITETIYQDSIRLPDGVIPDIATHYLQQIGKERKKTFLLLKIPAYNKDAITGIGKRLRSLKINVKEYLAVGNNTMSKNIRTESPLAKGQWYQIAINKTGLYKIDYDFIKKNFSLEPGSLKPENIRVFGNGGNMLAENNAIPRRLGLTENAVELKGMEDGVFNPGDYILFYGVGPTSWTSDTPDIGFIHQKHLYEDRAFYFLNFDQSKGLRVTEQQTSLTANTNVSAYDAFDMHEEDVFNPGKIGKQWWGEEFSNSPGKALTKTISFQTENALSPINAKIYLGAICPASSNFEININGAKVNTVPLDASAKNSDDIVISAKIISESVAAANKIDIELRYNPGVSDGKGFLNFIEINYRSVLAFTGSQILFRDKNSFGVGKVARYELNNSNNATEVWDITDALAPVRMKGQLNGTTFSFTQDAGKLRTFVACKDDQLYLPDFKGIIGNQNIYGQDQVDYIIVTHPLFWDAANRLADFHRQRNNLRVLVLTTTQVYNEFSSGSQDISAIRDMVKMFYDRGTHDGDMPRYLLLMGDASYDYKNRIANNTNYVPTFESAESQYLINGFCNDDFFGFLDDNEDIENTDIPNTLDVGVGRLPVKTAQEADDVVAKILNYKSPASLGPWRISAMVVADNEDNAGPHMEDAEIMLSTVLSNSNVYNGTKVYLDATPIVSTPGGARAPAANKTINDRVARGTFLINYNGHGNTEVLAGERIITLDDYRKWRNFDKLPFIITATCDFGRFDHPEYVSAGEQLVLKRDGGVIAALTTTQLVYQYANRIINRSFLDAQFRHNDRWNTFGDALRIAKNETYLTVPDRGTLINFRKFALLGDPALTPDFPEFKIGIDEVVDPVLEKPVDTIKALGAYMIKGSVRDNTGNILDKFNGKLDVTLFDKPLTIRTITAINKYFKLQQNVIYRGKVSVTNGRFSYTFLVPKDVNDYYSNGRLSSYADNGSQDAAGVDTSLVLGGYSDHPVIENMPPVVKPYMNDSLFRNGGITGANTSLFAILEDETGINVSGNAVGHDLTAILDNDVKNPYVLNDYYETALNTYKRGYVSFPIVNLPNGWHNLRIKAWDANNNSGEGSVNFEVIDGSVVQIRELMNYPNPFTDQTRFVFEHNHPSEQLNALINIYNATGSLVKSISKSFLATSSRSEDITWDGTGNNGITLPSGVYYYRISISTEEARETLGYQKLVLIR